MKPGTRIGSRLLSLVHKDDIVPVVGAAILGAGLSIAISLMTPAPSDDAATATTGPASIVIADPISVIAAVRESLPPPPRTFSRTVRIGSGDTLDAVLSEAGLSAQDRHLFSRGLAKTFDPRDLKVGQEISLDFIEHPAAEIGLTVGENEAFTGLHLETRPGQSVIATVGDGGTVNVRTETAPTTTDMNRHEGTINSSLYEAAVDAGVPPNVLVAMIRTFSFDVDFQRDIRQGDGFEIMYERTVLDDGRVVGEGDIKFASMTLRGKRHAVYAFKNDRGFVDYYSENGAAVRKTLLRTPVNGARLSSGFGKRRHPVLGYTKMHKGTDFAAPTGTPIYAAGDGVIEVRKWWGSYGRYVRIRHNSEFATAYAHMSRFASGLKQGSRVRQGQVIGYVGATGRVTGAHLHYEVLKNKAQVNPMKVTFPAAETLKGKELERFMTARTAIDSTYASLAPKTATRMAAADDPSDADHRHN